MDDSGCFGLRELVRVTGVEELLETHAQRFAFERELPVGAAWLEPHDPNRVVQAAVTPGVTLSLAERAQPSHGPTLRRTPDGSCHAGRIRA
jgi:hypothetical protein